MKIAIAVLPLILLLLLSSVVYASEVKELVFDPDLVSTLNWSYGVYRAGGGSYVKHDAENSLFLFSVEDDVNDDKLSWGYLHQGVQHHSWGYWENKPLKCEFEFQRGKSVNWILNITLQRSQVTWLHVNESSIPEWLKGKGTGQIAIGVMFAFETENQDYMGDVNSSCILQFEIQFCRIRWDGEKEVYLFDEFFTASTERGDEDNDVHNIYVPYGDFKQYFSPSNPLKSNVVQTYVIDLYPLFEHAWNRWMGLFNVENAILKWVNFYVETINAKIDAKLYAFNTYVKTSDSTRLSDLKIWVPFLILFIIAGVVKWWVK